MFGPRIHLFKVFGFPLRLDLSWLFIAVILSWSLAANYFPEAVSGLGQGKYWTMGVVGMLGLFVSVVLHELGHALVARRHELEIRGITLFIFGGVAEMTEEPRSAKAEFQVAVGGPLVSLVLAGLFWGSTTIPLTSSVEAVLRYLALINTILLVFNLIPAFPLDGGRVLRAIIWHYGNSLRKATRINSRIGAAFGWVMIGLGALQLLAGFLLSAIWWAILGMFLKGAANSSYQQLLIRRLLHGEPVRKFMEKEPVTVNPSLTLKEVVENYVYRHHHKSFPVVDESGELKGIIHTRQIRNVAQQEWTHTTAGDLAKHRDPKIPWIRGKMPWTPFPACTKASGVVLWLSRTADWLA